MWGYLRSCWKNHFANKVTYRIHLNEALYAMFYSLEIGQLWSLYIIRSLIHIKTNIRIVWDFLYNQELLGGIPYSLLFSILFDCIAIYSVAHIKWNHKTCVSLLWQSAFLDCNLCLFDKGCVVRHKHIITICLEENIVLYHKRCASPPWKSTFLDCNLSSPHAESARAVTAQ